MDEALNFASVIINKIKIVPYGLLGPQGVVKNGQNEVSRESIAIFCPISISTLIQNNPLENFDDLSILYTLLDRPNFSPLLIKKNFYRSYRL